MKNGNPLTQQHFCQKMHIAHQIVYYNYQIEICCQFIQVKKKRGSTLQTVNFFNFKNLQI